MHSRNSNGCPFCTTTSACILLLAATVARQCSSRDRQPTRDAANRSLSGYLRFLPKMCPPFIYQPQPCDRCACCPSSRHLLPCATRAVPRHCRSCVRPSPSHRHPSLSRILLHSHDSQLTVSFAIQVPLSPAFPPIAFAAALQSCSRFVSGCCRHQRG